MQLAQPDERVRLWISNALVIDQWTSLASLTPAATPSTLTNNVPYTVKIQYKVRGNGARKIAFKKTVAAATSVVPSFELFKAYDLAWPDIPYDSTVQNYGTQTYFYPVIGPDNKLPTNAYSAIGVPTSTCASQALLSGPGLTIATSTQGASFTIRSRDTYTNTRGTYGNDDTYIVSVTQSGAPTVHGSPKKSGQGLYDVSYQVTSQGSHTIFVSTPLSGGLHATYFSAVDLTSASYIRVDDMQTRTYGSGDAVTTTEWPGDVAEPMSGAAFTVRWEGFVKPELTGTYR
jgi:hypothetical protein